MSKKPVKPKRSSNTKLNENCVIYARYSSHNQKDMSIEQQVSLGRSMAADLGLTVIEVYADRAVSGRTDNRPDFQRMMKEAERGGFKYVIAWKSSRIGRNMLEAMINEARLSDFGVRLLYVEEDFEDNAAGRFAARTMMNVNQFYSESMSEDILRGLHSNAEKCLVNGSLPLGFKRGADGRFAVDEPNASIVREIFRGVAEGRQFIDIADDLNARGLRTSKGKPFNKNSFRIMLRNERYRGVYIYQDVRIENGVPRIIDDDLFFKVQEVMDMKDQNPVGGRHNIFGDYLLTGKLFCGECRSPMRGVSGTSKTGAVHHYYRCNHKNDPNCKKKIVRRDLIEKTVAQGIRDCILKDDVIEWIADSTMDYQKKQRDNPEIDLLKSRLADVQLSLKNILKAIEAGIFTETTKDRIRELEDERSDLTAKLAAAEYNIVDVSKEYIIEWLHSFRDGDVEDKEYLNALFSTFISAVYVYDDKRVKVVFSIGGNEQKTVDLDFPDEPPESSFKLSTAPPLESKTNSLLIMVNGFFVLSLQMR